MDWIDWIYNRMFRLDYFQSSDFTPHCMSLMSHYQKAIYIVHSNNSVSYPAAASSGSGSAASGSGAGAATGQNSAAGATGGAAAGPSGFLSFLFFFFSSFPSSSSSVCEEQHCLECPNFGSIRKRQTWEETHFSLFTPSITTTKQFVW